MKRSSCTRVIFGDCPIWVTVWEGRGLCVVDPSRQTEVRPGWVRVWIAYDNQEKVLNPKVRAQTPPVSASQTTLAIKGYAAFLNPRLIRPLALDAQPQDYTLPIGERRSIDYFYDEDDGLVVDEPDAWAKSLADDYRDSLYDDAGGDADAARPYLSIVNYVQFDEDDDSAKYIDATEIRRSR